MFFINFTNHPVNVWSETQIAAAKVYGEIKELPFPAVDSKAKESDIVKQAEEIVQKIIEMEPAAVLCQGEFCLAYAVISRLKQQGVKVLAACSERLVEIDAEGRKVVSFQFEQYREYK